MTVTAVWPGATAAEMQEQVADRLEKRLQELAYYDRVESISHPGFVAMVLTFKESTPPGELQDLFYQARKKLGDERANLPQGVLGPFFNDEYSDVYFALYALEAGALPHRQQVLLAEDLRQRFLRLPGVKKVNILGEQAPAHHRSSSPTSGWLRWASSQSRSSRRSPHRTASSRRASSRPSGPRAYIRVDGDFDTLERIENVPVAANGRLLRIADVAR